MSYESFDDFARCGSLRLLGAARLLVHDREVAEDLTQETLIRMFRAWSSIRADAAVDSYAYKTLLRLAHRRLRQLSAGREVLTASLPDQADQADQGVDGEDIGPRVRACLLELPARQRATLVLRFYAGLNVDDTAKVMACSQGTVKSQTAKGLRNLRVLLVSTMEQELAQQGDDR